MVDRQGLESEIGEKKHNTKPRRVINTSMKMIALRNSLCLLLFLGLLSMPSTQAVQCYDCVSVVNYGCGDPFDDAGISTAEGGYCSKFKGSTGGISSVVRSAETGTPPSSGCTSVNYGGVDAHVCYCSTDLCNSGMTFHAGREVVFVSVVAYLARILI